MKILGSVIKRSGTQLCNLSVDATLAMIARGMDGVPTGAHFSRVWEKSKDVEVIPTCRDCVSEHHSGVSVTSPSRRARHFLSAQAKEFRPRSPPISARSVPSAGHGLVIPFLGHSLFTLRNKRSHRCIIPTARPPSICECRSLAAATLHFRISRLSETWSSFLSFLH